MTCRVLRNLRENVTDPYVWLYVLRSLWATVSNPIVWRLAIGVPLVASCLALAYVPGLVADEEPTTLRVARAEIPAVDTP